MWHVLIANTAPVFARQTLSFNQLEVSLSTSTRASARNVIRGYVGLAGEKERERERERDRQRDRQIERETDRARET